MENNNEKIHYEMAVERVRKIRKFYTGILVFAIVFGVVYGIRFFKHGFLQNLEEMQVSWIFVIWGLILAVKGFKLFFFNSDWDKKEDIRYQQAVKRVKRLKGFYSHLTVYVFVNILLIFLNLSEIREEHTFWSWEIWSTPFFWGIGLAAHAMSVFSPIIFFGKNWEERKTKELMEKYK